MIQLKWIFLNCLFINHKTISLPVTGDGNRSSIAQPYINIKIRDQDDSYMEEFFKGGNDAIFDAPTGPGDFSGVRMVTGTLTAPEKPTLKEASVEEPLLPITVLLPRHQLIHAHFRGNQHLIYEETEYVNSSERFRRVQEAPTKRPTRVIRDFEMIDSNFQRTRYNRYNMGIRKEETNEETDSFWDFLSTTTTTSE